MKDKKKNYSPCSCIMKLVETNQENQTKKTTTKHTHFNRILIYVL